MTDTSTPNDEKKPVSMRVNPAVLAVVVIFLAFLVWFMYHNRTTDKPAEATSQPAAEVAQPGLSNEAAEKMLADADAAPSRKAYFQLGLTFHKAGDFQHAIKAFSKCLPADSADIDALNNLGVCYSVQGMFESAIPVLAKVVSLSPTYQLGINNLKDTKMKYENELKANYESLTDASALVNQSIVSYNKGNFNECILQCIKAISINPKLSEPYNNACAAYNSVKNYEMAEKFCSKALELNPNLELAKNNRKWAQEQMKKKY